MNKFRQWINKDDGRWFQVGNEDLNYLQIIGCGFMVLGLLLFPVRQHLFPEIPKWIHISVFIVYIAFYVAGETIRKTK